MNEKEISEAVLKCKVIEDGAWIHLDCPECGKRVMGLDWDSAKKEGFELGKSEMLDEVEKIIEKLPSEATNHEFDRGWNHAIEFIKEDLGLLRNVEH